MSAPERFDSTTDLSSSGTGDDTKGAVLVIILTSIIVSFVGIVLSAVAISRPPPPPVTVATVAVTGGTGASRTPAGNRIWLIAHGHDWGAYEYFDSEGKISGFSHELALAACKAGNMNCSMVWDMYTNCWQSKAGEHPRGGPGLMDGWYDACTGWVQTVDRVHTYAFSDPFLKTTPARFFVKKGNTAAFDGSDLKGKTIVFMDGWAIDEKCLARQQDVNHRNYVLPKGNIIHVSTPEKGIEFLTNGKAYALFSDEHSMGKFSEIEAVPNVEFNCYLSGNSMMTRKDSDFSKYFNVGLRKLKDSGEFAEICRKAKDKHGPQGDIAC